MWTSLLALETPSPKELGLTECTGGARQKRTTRVDVPPPSGTGKCLTMTRARGPQLEAWRVLCGTEAALFPQQRLIHPAQPGRCRPSVLPKQRIKGCKSRLKSPNRAILLQKLLRRKHSTTLLKMSRDKLVN